MSTTASATFTALYIPELHEAYQQKASKLRNACRLKTGVIGSTCVFPKGATGAAGLKTRHGNVPLMNAVHSQVTATLSDYYAADYVDSLDALKSNIDDMKFTANTGAYALGRKIDNLLITVLDSGAGTADTASSLGLTKGRILGAFEALNAADVPGDGRFCLVGAHQWNELLNLEEFASSLYAGDKYAWLKGTEARIWLGTTFMFHSGLPLASGVRKCFMYHQDAIGLAEGQNIKAYTDWVPEKAAYLIDNVLSAGAVAIDGNGIYEIECDDDEAIS